MSPEEQFSLRLSTLRAQKGVSARDMSLSLGQNAGYINNIERGKALPTMSNFFYICDYLEVTPQEFLDFNVPMPSELRRLSEYMIRLTPQQISNISGIVKDLAEANEKK